MNDILITPIGLLSNFVAFKRAICPITTTLFFDTYNILRRSTSTPIACYLRKYILTSRIFRNSQIRSKQKEIKNINKQEPKKQNQNENG